jgi:hypothetical protein
MPSYCKTAEPVARNTPIITGSSTWVSRLIRVSWQMQIIWLMPWDINRWHRVIISIVWGHNLATTKEGQVCFILILEHLIRARLDWVELVFLAAIIKAWPIISCRITWPCNSLSKIKNFKCK